jgi:hypothetical protein
MKESDLTFRLRTRPEPNLVPFPGPYRQIRKAVHDIANHPGASMKSRLIELEAIADDIEDLWEQMVRDLDHLDLLDVTSRR